MPVLIVELAFVQLAVIYVESRRDLLDGSFVPTIDVHMLFGFLHILFALETGGLFCVQYWM